VKKRIIRLFFLLAKTHRGGQDAETYLRKAGRGGQALERGHACPVRRGVREGNFCTNRVQKKKCI
jgi:hypothetical protein